MEILHGFMNYCSTVFVLIIMLCVVLLMCAHAIVSFRNKQISKRKRQLYDALEQYAAGGNAKTLFSAFQSRKGVEVLTKVIGECDEVTVKRIREIAKAAAYDDFLKKQLHNKEIAYCTMVLKLVGELRLQGFSGFVLEFLYKYRKNIDLQYVGFLALSLLGDAEALIPVCMDGSYTQALSFRSLKEIFKHFSGDRARICSVLLKAPDNYVRRVCLIMIGEYKIQQLATDTSALLDDKDMNIVLDSVRALGQLKYAPIVPRIQQLISHEKWEVRSAAVRALANIDLEQYARDVAKGLYDKEWWVRYNAAATLTEYSRLQELAREVIASGDKFAIEILRYAVQRKALKGEALPT